MTEQLSSIITNATVRKVVYSIIVIIGLAIAATAAGFAAIGAVLPQWFVFTAAAFGVIAGSGGAGLALANTPAQSTSTFVPVGPGDLPEEGQTDGTAGPA